MQIWKRNNQQWLDFNENGLNIVAPEFHFYLCPPVYLFPNFLLR